MTKIVLDINSCKQCLHWKEGDAESTDGFDRGHDWSCVHPKNIELKLICSFVEWHEVNKVKIPEWCPAKKVNDGQ